MSTKKALFLVLSVLFVLSLLLVVWLYKPVKALRGCHNALNQPPMFVYSESGFRYCMSQKDVPSYFTNIYIELRYTIERNHEVKTWINNQ